MSIRVRILIAYLAMLAIPLALIIGLDRMLHSYHRGDPLWIARILRPKAPFARIAREMNVAARRINLRILEDPDSFARTDVMRTLEPEVEDLGFVVRRGDTVVYRSLSLQGPPLPPLPPFGALPQGEPPPELPAFESVLAQWDFRFSDGTPGSLFLVRNPRNESPGRPPLVPDLNVLLIVSAVVALALGNGLLTFFVARSMVRPLRALEQAAGRISAGDLDTPMAPHGRRDEIGRVCEAFERMRQALRASLEKQRQYEQNRLEMIASISHDLRTPVTTIRGYAEGLRDGVADTPEKRERYLQTIIERAVQTDRLIEELFLLSTLELEEAPFRFRRLDLREFLADSVEDLRGGVERAGASVHLEAPQGPVAVRADPWQLRRVIENVVGNAVRHSGRCDTRIEVRLAARGSVATIEVRDNGRGIPREALPHIFDRFYRADSARSTPGSGLGLTIARRIVEAHGGNIRAESEEGRGTCIVVTLPMEAGP